MRIPLPPPGFKRAALAVITTCLLFAGHIAAQKGVSRPRATFVTVEAIVADGNGRPVQGLHQADFQVKEDGLPVTVTSFTEVSAAGISGDADRRIVVLLLDDVGNRPTGTLVVPPIARLFLADARPRDSVAVVRLSHHDDEAAGNLAAALARIDEYRGGAVPFFGRETVEDLLKTVARVARQWEPLEHQRKSLICIGAQAVCGRSLRVSSHSLLWPFWVDALAAAGRANLSVYTVDPSGVRGQLAREGGLVEDTGGAAFVSNNYEDAVRRVWEEAGHYYLLGYEPTAGKRELHSIEITVKGAGLHVRARHTRGD